MSIWLEALLRTLVILILTSIAGGVMFGIAMGFMWLFGSVGWFIGGATGLILLLYLSYIAEFYSKKVSNDD